MPNFNGQRTGSPLDRDEHMRNEVDDMGGSDSRLNSKHNLITMNRGNGFGSNRNQDLDRQISLLKSCECIKESEVRDLCNLARDILLEESNIQNISSPITVSTSSFYDLTKPATCRFAETSTASFMT